MENYTNRELGIMLQELKAICTDSREHIKKTNGRVKSLEIWRGIMAGGLGVITAIVIPLLFILLADYLK